jgi:hypothetical protein
MAGITLAQAEAQLAAYLAAETAVLAGQSYTISGRTLTRADLASIQAGITLWDQRAKNLGASALGRSRARTIVPAN